MRHKASVLKDLNVTVLVPMTLLWAGLSAAVPVALAQERTDLDRAWSVLTRARQVMGLAEPGFSAGRIVLEGTGTLDYDARDQGMAPGEPHVVANVETLAFDFHTGRAIYEYRQPRADGSVRWRREDYVEPGQLLFVELTGRRAELSQGPRAAAGRRRVARRLPQNLVEEAIERRASLTWLGRGRIAFTLSDGTPLTLGFDDESGFLTTVEILEDQPLRGDVVIRWEFTDYRPVEGFGAIAHRYRVLVGEAPFVDVRLHAIVTGTETNHGVFDLPEDIGVPELHTEGSASSGQPALEAREVAAGIYFVPNVRPGINAFFADMGELVLAYDAPAGYRLIDEIPPGRLAPGSSSRSVTEAFIALIHRTVPGKDIRHVVISHYHSDHLGGVRAFLSEGTEIVVPSGLGELVRQVARTPHRIAEGLNAQDIDAPRIVEVSERLVIEGSSRTAEVLFIGDAPHASAMLVVRFPETEVFFTGDLFYPSPLGSFPNPNREPIMQFFVDWLDQRGLDPSLVLASHAGVIGTAEHVSAIRQRR